MEPLPFINKFFALIVQQEKQLTLSSSSSISESGVFAAQGILGPPQGPRHVNNLGNYGYKRPMCAFCAYFGHTVDKCYKKHGYPSGFKPRVKVASSNSCEVHAPYVDSMKTNISEIHVPSQPIFTQEQYQKLLAHVQTVPSVASSSSNPTSTHIISSINTLTTDVSDKSHMASILEASASSNLCTLPWILDTEASDHMACSLSCFASYNPVKYVYVRLPNKNLITFQYRGTVILSPTLILTNVLYVPAFTFNLISASKLTSSNSCCLIFQSDFCFIQDLKTWKMIGLARQIRGLYHFVHTPSVASIVSDSTFDLWHCCLGHVSHSRLPVLQNLNSSINFLPKSSCEACHYAKHKRLPFPISNTVSKHCFDLIHVDIWGPIELFLSLDTNIS